MTRTALVTGGTRGIGAAVSHALQVAGYAVAATYHGNDAAAEAFKAETGVPVFKWDVADGEACEAGVEDVSAVCGPIDILINNAGVTRDGVLHKMSHEDWDAVIDTDLTAAFNMCRAVVPGMRQRDYGRIINISSINGQKGQFGQSNYAAAKAGLVGFTKSVALENAAKGITVNAVAPGYIETDMVAAVPRDVLKEIITQIPAGRLGRPEDVARVVIFLASDAADFVTGSTLTVNGGQYMA